MLRYRDDKQPTTPTPRCRHPDVQEDFRRGDGEAGPDDGEAGPDDGEAGPHDGEAGPDDGEAGPDGGGGGRP